MADDYKILIVGNGQIHRKKMEAVFAQSKGGRFEVEFRSYARTASITTNRLDYSAAMIDFEPDPQLALTAAWRLRSIAPDLGIAVLASSSRFLAPVEMIELGLGPLVIIDDDGISSLPLVALALADAGSEKPSEMTAQSNLRLRHQELRDITDSLARQSIHLIHLKNELASQKNKMETVINSMTDGMAFFDADGSLEVINPVAEKILFALNMKADPIFTELTTYLKEKTINNDDRNIDTSGFEIGIGDKTVRIRITSLAQPESSMEGSLIIMTDVTHDREYEKLKDDFTNMISHELRTPLTAIRAAVDNLDRGNLGDVTELQRKFFSIIARNVDRQQELINNMLDLAKFESNIMETTKENSSLATVATMCVEQFSYAFLDKQVKLDLEINPNTPHVEIDQSLITQAINNLLSNALKFTAAGDTVTVTVTEKELDGEPFTCVTVMDTGEGIARDKIDYVFDKYTQADRGPRRRSAGAGLGLAICKEIVKTHSGHITVKSEVGRGSEFTILIPVN
ncbi:hypothetical protein MNBD_NITROSPINAE02-1706 [hydrothermal vent metagenome]|uniref:histidine kinase n=1 Tax=hydrothermal vent metagenome TaxID=652676 RepID=A0A3B1BLS1_9ZZZZ